jgi:hypothetical protein
MPNAESDPTQRLIADNIGSSRAKKEKAVINAFDEFRQQESNIPWNRWKEFDDPKAATTDLVERFSTFLILRLSFKASPVYISALRTLFCERFGRDTPI